MNCEVRTEVPLPMMGMVNSVLLVVVLLGLAFSQAARAQLGAPDNELCRLLGSPVKSSAAFRYYRKPPYCFVIHIFEGKCDQICISSGFDSSDLPAQLSEKNIQDLLQKFGGGVTWNPVQRLSMNRVWNSSDGKSFAIYETIYNKLVIMTRAAYRREKKAKS